MEYWTQKKSQLNTYTMGEIREYEILCPGILDTEEHFKSH